jgi:hypothetical protein
MNFDIDTHARKYLNKIVPETKTSRLGIRDITRIIKKIDGDIFGDKCVKYNGPLAGLSRGVEYVYFSFRLKKVSLHRLLYHNFVEPLPNDCYIKSTCDLKYKCVCLKHMAIQELSNETRQKMKKTQKKLEKVEKHIQKIPNIIKKLELKIKKLKEKSKVNELQQEAEDLKKELNILQKADKMVSSQQRINIRKNKKKITDYDIFNRKHPFKIFFD